MANPSIDHIIRLHDENWRRYRGDAPPAHRWHDIYPEWYDWIPAPYRAALCSGKHRESWWQAWQDLEPFPINFAGTAVMYSGGLESVFVGLQQLTPADCFFMFEAKQWHYTKGLSLLEPALLLMVGLTMQRMHPGTGGRIVVGMEDGSDRPEVWGHSWPFLRSFSAKTGIELALPVSTFNKFELFLRATRSNLTWSGCDFDTEWCGRCFKCWQVAIFYAAIWQRPPFKIYRTPDMERFRLEYLAWKQTGIDSFGDLEHIEEAVKYAGEPLDNLLARIPWSD